MFLGYFRISKCFCKHWLTPQRSEVCVVGLCSLMGVSGEWIRSSFWEFGKIIHSVTLHFIWIVVLFPNSAKNWERMPVHINGKCRGVVAAKNIRSGDSLLICIYRNVWNSCSPDVSIWACYPWISLQSSSSQCKVQLMSFQSRCLNTSVWL